jgi:hypothetical protein
MPGFSIRNPYFIIVVCLALVAIGVVSLARMPVDLFPAINIPEVVVATFYSGMPPEDIEFDITNPLERFFTLASGVDHSESRSLLGVSIIKVHFQPGTSADADVTQLSNLALADLKRLPPGLPGDRLGRRAQRDAASRLRPIPDPQPDRRAERRRDPAAVRRQVPPDHGLCRPVQDGFPPTQSHGRGDCGEQLKPDHTGGRRKGRPNRLLRLLE